MNNLDQPQLLARNKRPACPVSSAECGQARALPRAPRAGRSALTRALTLTPSRNSVPLAASLARELNWPAHSRRAGKQSAGACHSPCRTPRHPCV